MHLGQLRGFTEMDFKNIIGVSLLQSWRQQCFAANRQVRSMEHILDKEKDTMHKLT